MKRSLREILTSSIVKKQAMGITGLLLCGFLVTHLLGNFLIFLGPEALNTYAYNLTHNKAFFYTAEVILLLLFGSHIAMAVKLVIENNLARPVNYYVKQHTGRGATFASSTMPYTGLIVLVFLVLHLLHFRFGPHYLVTYEGVEMRDVYTVVIDYFKSPLNVAWYIFAVLALAIHVSHGLWSAFQSIGFNHPKYTPALKILAKVYAVFIFVGFSSLPIYCHLVGGQ